MKEKTCIRCGLNPNSTQSKEQQKWEEEYIVENKMCSACVQELTENEQEELWKTCVDNKTITEKDVEITDDEIICDDLSTLKMIVGTSSVVGNLHRYDVEKKDGVFHVPKETVRKRIRILKNRIKKNEHHLNIMEQVLNE